MRAHQINLLASRASIVIAAVAVIGGQAWAASSACTDPASAVPMQPAGHVIFSEGPVEAQSGAATRALTKGAPVCAGETIVTAHSGKAQIKMADGGLIAVRPDTKMKIETFNFDGKEDGTEKSVIALLQGGFRALTGLVGRTHKENYWITTPTATIGIRGTDHEPMYIPTPPLGQEPSAAPGTYDKVNSGGVVMSGAHGQVDIKPNQIGFVPDVPTAAPVILKEAPNFYQQGGEAGFGHGESHGERDGAGGHGDHAGDLQHNDGHENHVPGHRAPEQGVPEVRVPEVNTPGMHGSDD